MAPRTSHSEFYTHHCRDEGRLADDALPELDQTALFFFIGGSCKHLAHSGCLPLEASRGERCQFPLYSKLPKIAPSTPQFAKCLSCLALQWPLISITVRIVVVFLIVGAGIFF